MQTNVFPQTPNPYKPSGGMLQREDSLRHFPVRVTRIDYEKLCLSVENVTTGEIYDEIYQFPVAYSSMESTDLHMPETGQAGLAVFTSNTSGFIKVAITTWILSDTPSNLLAIAHRPLQRAEGFSTRRRGVHRKPYPGQRSTTLAMGYHEFVGAGWDRISADMSQDKLDPLRRQNYQLTGRKVEYSDAGLRLAGAINRPGADPTLVPEELLPDGTTRQVVYLRDSMAGSRRYTHGEKDLAPLSEVLDRVQEFALDFPVPYEALETPFLDTLLGTTQDPFDRTSVNLQAGIAHDDQSYIVDQDIDHPHDPLKTACGPAKGEGATPRRKGFIVERVQGTLVGYNRWDTSTYGRVLKPTLWPLTKSGRFGTNTETGVTPVKSSTDHVETRLAASAFHMRFPMDYNTTRLDVTKEGLVLLELGATIPKENIPWDNSTYEHPYGAGRSLEAHLVGSAKLVIGKNRDEEDSLDLATLGQVVLRIGADDGSLPGDGRVVAHQTRGKKDAVLPRDLQFWKQPKLKPGDAGDLSASAKTGAENVSLRAATDGGVFLRLGARHEKSRRRHLMNGYLDGQGRNQCPPGTGQRSRSEGRPIYGAGDAPYAFNDLRTAGKPISNLAPYFWSGDPVVDPDVHGLSLDAHAVRDIFIRVGKNKLMGQSILLDLEGGIVGIVGKDKKGRSLTGSMQGGIELTVGSNLEGRAIQLDIVGDVNMVVKGHYHVHATGDIVFDSMGSIYTLAKKEHISKGMNIRQAALVQHVTEAADIVHNQGDKPATGV